MDKAPLVALVIVLLVILKVCYSEWKKERAYRDTQEIKTLEALVRVAEVVKGNEQQSQKVAELLIKVEHYLSKLK